MSQVLEHCPRITAEYAQHSGRVERSAPQWLLALRRAAIARAGELGMPTNDMEEYRHTRLAPITGAPFPVAESAPAVTEAQVAPFRLAGDDVVELVFVNGHLVPGLSRMKAPAGVSVQGLAQALALHGEFASDIFGRIAPWQDHAFNALNLAFATDGAFIRIARGAAVETPVHLLFLGIGEAKAFSRNMIVAEPSSSAHIVETHASLDDKARLTNTVTEVVLHENATVEHAKVQRESTAALHLSTLAARLDRAAFLCSQNAHFGADVSRNDVHADLRGDGANAEVNGLAMLAGTQHCDNYLQVEHAAPNCPSHELYKFVLDGESQAGFRGRIHVHQVAQKTDAYQKNQTLLLSPDARINAKPQLEIYADDVKCSHGATIGRLDKTQMFYLRSRGIPEREARTLLVHAFAAGVTDRIKVAAVRESVEALIAERLPLPN